MIVDAPKSPSSFAWHWGVIANSTLCRAMEIVMIKDDQPAKNLQDIKDDANSIPKQQGERHMDRLNRAAQAAGFQCWNHARNVLAPKAPSGLLVSVKCVFKWHEKRHPNFWERAGHLQVRVTPLAGFP